jgi:DNA helicase-2/ATP-dependent DNA helicase PcrA
LEREGIPIRSKTGGRGGSEQQHKSKEVMDIMAYVSLACDVGDLDAAFSRVCNTPARGFGKQLQDSIKDYARLRKSSLVEVSKKMVHTFHGKQKTALRDFLSLISSWKKELDKCGSPGSIVDKIIEDTKYRSYLIKSHEKFPEKLKLKLENLEKFSTLAKSRAWSTKDFIESFSSNSKTEADKASNHVTVTTIHQGTFTV